MHRNHLYTKVISQSKRSHGQFGGNLLNITPLKECLRGPKRPKSALTDYGCLGTI